MSQEKPTKPFLTYDQALERLYQVGLFRKGKTFSHSPEALHTALNRPASKFPSVHVAGTNGKGSVSTKIAKAFELAGYHTGLYTSPHLLTFRERIRINGQMISEEDVVAHLEEIFYLTKKMRLKPTFFEIVTNIAAEYFHKRNVEVGVFEVGVGGRLDATNIIDSILSVITTIAEDHTHILGKTLNEIADEKAGIIRRGVPIVLGPQAHYNSILEKAQEFKCPVISVSASPGNFEIENRNIARAALQQLQFAFQLSDEIIEEAIKTTPPCRLQEASYKNRRVIIDVAHNEHALARLLQAIEVRYPRRSLQIIFGMSKDKDWKKCLRKVAAKAKHIHLPKIEHSRVVAPQQLHAILHQLGYTHMFCNMDATQALEAAAQDEGDIIVICGSFYIMESFMPLLENNASTSLASGYVSSDTPLTTSDVVTSNA